MNQWKRILLVAMALTVILSGCKQSEDQESSASESSESSVVVVEEEKPELPLQIGLLQFGEQPSYDSMREAFLSRLEEWGYDETKVSIDYQNAKGDEKTSQSITDSFLEKDVDLIVVFSSPAVVKQAIETSSSTETKILFLSPTDSGATSPHATGIIAPAYPNAVVELAKQATPGFNALGVLYNPDTVSTSEIEALKNYCTEQEIPLREQLVTNSAEAAAQMDTLCTDVGAVYIPFDDTISSAMGEVIQTAATRNTPIYSSESIWTQNGGLASVSFDYSQVGINAADMAVALIEGRTISELPVLTLPASFTYINHTTLDTLKKKFPDDVMKKARLLD